jgi:hypothetical protein
MKDEQDKIPNAKYKMKAIMYLKEAELSDWGHHLPERLRRARA